MVVSYSVGNITLFLYYMITCYKMPGVAWCLRLINLPVVYGFAY